MGIFDFLSQRKKNTANTAKNRLRIIDRSRNAACAAAPDYLPLLQRELLEVIRKYVNVDVGRGQGGPDQGRRQRRARHLGRPARENRYRQQL